MIALDTSVLVETLGAGGSMPGSLRDAIAARHRIVVPSLVLYEWLRGPRLTEELAAQEAIVPAADALPFGPAEAARAAELYRTVARPRGREIDLAIAACAMVWDAAVWTLNPDDFTDIPGVRLHRS